MNDVLLANSIVDANGTRINLPLATNVRDFLVAEGTEADEAYFLRVCPYIRAVDGLRDAADPAGRPIKETDLQAGRFSVFVPEFLESITAWYGLERAGREWKSNSKTITATQVKQWIQAALLPFKASTRTINDAYQQLQIKCATADIQTQPLELVTADDLNTKEFKKPTPIVGDFLFPGLVLFAAPAKTGKSFLALDLACSVAEGEPFWNFKTNQGDVLYLDIEGRDWRTKARLPSIGRKAVPQRLTHAYNAATVETGLIQQLEAWINGAHDPRLIIIDTLQHVKGRATRNEDAYTADTRFMKPLHDLAMSKSVAIICITHTRKSNGLILDDPFDSVIGSTAQYGNSDAGWLIVGKRDEKKKTFYATGRDFEPVAFEIELVNDGHHFWRINGTTEEQKEAAHRESYNNDKTVIVIREMVTASGGRFTTTARELWELVAQKTGEYPEADEKRMGGHINELVNDLLKYDGIVTHRPQRTKAGRPVIFEQRGFADGN